MTRQRGTGSGGRRSARADKAAARHNGTAAGAILGAALVLAGPGAALAQDGDLGRITYMMHCASCHGDAGGGDGPMAQFLEVEVPDLTMIQRDNGGVFPFIRVYRTIETGTENEVHGAAMPAWDERLLTDTYILHGIRIEPGEREAFVRGRILALIDHIARLQEQ